MSESNLLLSLLFRTPITDDPVLGFIVVLLLAATLVAIAGIFIIAMHMAKYCRKHKAARQKGTTE